MKGWPLAVISCVLLVLYVGIRRRTTADKPSELPSVQSVDLMIGDKVCRPDNQPWGSPNEKVLVSVGNAKCGACSANKPMEEELFERCRALGFAFYYVTPNNTANKTYIETFRLMGRQVIPTNLALFGAQRTPTMMRLRGDGTLEAMRIGTTDDADRKDVIDSLLGLTPPKNTYGRITSAELLACPSDVECTVLALARMPDGPLREKAIQIPSGQVDVRADYELRRTNKIYVDCPTARSALACQAAAIALVANGFQRVFVVDLPRRPTKC
jgi:hypothetical protein